MSIGRDLLRELLDDSDFVEAVSVLPAGAAESARVTLDARVVREVAASDKTDKGYANVFRARVRVFSNVDADHGGIVAPVVGDNWTIAHCRGGTGVSGWMSKAATGGDGIWEIEVTLTEFEEKGASRK